MLYNLQLVAVIRDRINFTQIPSIIEIRLWQQNVLRGMSIRVANAKIIIKVTWGTTRIQSKNNTYTV